MPVESLVCVEINNDYIFKSFVQVGLPQNPIILSCCFDAGITFVSKTLFLTKVARIQSISDWAKFVIDTVADHFKNVKCQLNCVL